jgi:single-strand DNA-binding protein
VAGKNRLDIIGNVGGDPVVKTVNGKKVANFNVGVSLKKDDETTWFRCAVWEQQAETIEKYVQKGDMINVIGPVTVRLWDGNDGKTNASLEVQVREFTLIGKPEKRNGNGNGNGAAAAASNGNTEEF